MSDFSATGKRMALCELVETGTEGLFDLARALNRRVAFVGLALEQWRGAGTVSRDQLEQVRELLARAATAVFEADQAYTSRTPQHWPYRGDV